MRSLACIHTYALHIYKIYILYILNQIKYTGIKIFFFKFVKLKQNGKMIKLCKSIFN